MTSKACARVTIATLLLTVSTIFPANSNAAIIHLVFTAGETNSGGGGAFGESLNKTYAGELTIDTSFGVSSAALNDFSLQTGTFQWTLESSAVSDFRYSQSSTGEIGSFEVSLFAEVNGVNSGLNIDSRSSFAFIQSYNTFPITSFPVANTCAFCVDFQQLSSVPAPASVWLMGSGLLGLMGFSRKNKTQVVA